jgi:2-phospho-L-lactate guanylyltransferase (CobY/MobA/RfbA family)
MSVHIPREGPPRQQSNDHHEQTAERASPVLAAKEFRDLAELVLDHVAQLGAPAQLLGRLLVVVPVHDALKHKA